MKKRIKACSLALLLSASLVLAACGGESGGGTANVVDFNLTQSEKGEITESFDRVTVVHDAYGRQYETMAAEKLVEFFNEQKSGFATAVDIGDFKSQGAREYVVYLGNIDAGKSNRSWDKFNKNGYLIEAEKNSAVIKGSCSEFTYYASSRFANLHLGGDADYLTNVKTGNVYREAVEVNREEYIDDISKFPVVWQYEWESPAWLHDFEEKTAQFFNKNGRPMVFGHRGDMENYPENSIEGIISGIHRGVDGFEIDIWRTKDGVYVLNHTNELQETTDYLLKKGKVVDGVQLPESSFIKDWTYEQIQRLNLRYNNGQYSGMFSEVTEFKMPTLEEVLKVTDGKCYLSMDRLNYDLDTGATLPSDKMGLNNPYWEDVYGLMKKTGNVRSSLFLNMALNPADANALRQIVNEEFNINTPTIFDRTGTHNCVTDWYAEFECTDYDALYEKWLTEGVFQAGVLSTGNYLLCNKPSKFIEYLDKHYAK